ncbi:hypothetical protein [Evansella cellulosilytica]|uniref:Uncharacterized protein n=1 Tax=Evansella cellulosilytica (strain ATCC 21833 / DSM 2522 / FERM P-1141 / JCM 9156 / N-4) TaxID=649639 RepID=E6TS08_EVAC2|nr:hypothetical protein [Evansella cellulosilytica]ADU30662.1 hypothetical protein Bcell_2404 [Evansella cellulosilytica DSM 2522]
MDTFIVDFLHVIGPYFIPISFLVYILLRPIFYLRGEIGSKSVKAIWYIIAAYSAFEGFVELRIIVGSIALVEAWDLVFQHLENKREMKRAKSLENLNRLIRKV